MGEMVPDWAQMWGAKVKMPTDMRDDMLRDAIETCRDALDQCADFEAEGMYVQNATPSVGIVHNTENAFLQDGLATNLQPAGCLNISLPRRTMPLARFR